MPEIWRSTKKTDRADVEVMIQRLQVMGELPESHRMTRPQRELRSLTRRLGDFRHQRRRILNQIHAIIDSDGMPAKKESFVKEAWREEMNQAPSYSTDGAPLWKLELVPVSWRV
jgi:hypothetical protein